MTHREITSEIAACCGLFVFLFALLVFGNALRPYEPSMHSETTYQESR